MLFFLFAILVVLLIFNYIFNKKDVIAPSFIFTLSILFGVVWTIFYYNNWEMSSFHLNTFLVIGGGVFIFSLTSFCILLFFKKIKGEGYYKNSNEIIEIDVDLWKKILVIIFALFTVIYSGYCICKATGTTDLFRAMKIYDSQKFKDGTLIMPFFFSKFRIITNALGFWFMYVLINNFKATKKIDFYSLSITVLGMLNSLITGSRSAAIGIIIFGITIYLLLLNKEKGFYKSISKKSILILCLIIVGILATFKISLNLLGRSTNENFLDYMALYCGAEVKNLDIYLQEEHVSDNNYFGSQTFVSIIEYAGSKLNWKDSQYALDLPYRKVNGYNLGNVYTVFYPFIYDFGYIGLIILVVVMSAISQLIYEKCKRACISNVPLLSIMIYAYIFRCLVFAFFSNKFYENIASKGFIDLVLIWYLCNCFFVKFKIEITEPNNDEKNIISKNLKRLKFKYLNGRNEGIDNESK